MLAERRQKQKWSLNPRGKWWTEDSNKFGQRMLEKMGWTKGKGLGANEQGITEFSSVSHKNDTTGVGYDKNVEMWTEHQEKFGDLLQQLNGNQDQDAGKNSANEDANLNGQSIELKSKQSHARIHYKKFTRGKDITKYKSKDLANIFGQKELAEKKIQSKTKKDDIPETEVGVRDNWYGVATINGGNMADYFKLKSNYNNTDRSTYNVNNDANLSSSMTENRTTDSESESDQHVGFGFISKTEGTQSVANYGALKDSDGKSSYAFDNPCLGLNSPTETAGGTNRGSPAKSMKKRKKEFESDNLHVTEIDKRNARKKLKTEVIDGDCRNGFINPALNLDARPEEDCNGKEFEVVRAQFGLENCGLDLTDERNGKKRVTFNDHVMLYEYNLNSTKNKRKGEVTLDKFEVENKKSKKKRKHESTATPVTNGFVNKALDVQILFEEINDNELNEHRNKKVKKRKVSNLETIQESPEKEIIEISTESEDTLDTNGAENGETDNVEPKLKKKKKKQKKKEKEEKRAKDIIVLDAINEEPDIEIVKVISNKKKKAKDSKEEEETAISKKCKKKKKKDKENCKSEKHTIQTEISNDQQDIKILDKSDSRRQQNDLIESKNKDAAIIETLLDPTTKEEEEKSLEKTKQKKKKRKSLDKEDSNEINVCNTEREISDKENTDKEQDLNAKKLVKKDKKSKKSKHKNASDVEDSSNHNKEVADVNVTKQDEIENAECTETPSKKGKVINAIDNIINSPWNVKARMSKKMLITLFHNNAILEFPGSNIHNIKGYGTDDVECEL